MRVKITVMVKYCCKIRVWLVLILSNLKELITNQGIDINKIVITTLRIIKHSLILTTIKLPIGTMTLMISVH